MGEKLIDADKIEGLKVRYSTMEHYMREDTDSLVKSSASDAFREATAKAKEMAKDLTETVDALDEFLNSAAREFRAMDNNIASVIGGEKLATFTNSEKGKVAAYNELSGQDKKQMEFSRSKYSDYPY